MALQWSDADFERGFISLRGGKNKKTARIPLSSAARVVLKKIERTGNPYIFSGRDRGQRVDYKCACPIRGFGGGARSGGWVKALLRGERGKRAA
jgi:integrase